MRLIAIDISGSMPSEHVDLIRRDIRVGDVVVSFDTHLSNIKTMKSDDDIKNYQLHGAGGTLWEPVRDYIMELAGRHGNVEARVYSDCFFAMTLPEPIEGATITMVVPPVTQMNHAGIRRMQENGIAVVALGTNEPITPKTPEEVRADLEAAYRQPPQITEDESATGFVRAATLQTLKRSEWQ